MILKENQMISQDYIVKITLNKQTLSFFFSSKELAFDFFIQKAKKISLTFIKNKTCFFSSSFYYKQKILLEESTSLIIKDFND